MADMDVMLSEYLYDLAIENGGFTYNLHTGTTPKQGYAVALQGRECKVERLSARIIDEYVDEHAEAITVPGACVGAWYSPEADTWYLDVSIVLASLDEALVVGRANKQLAVYDLATGRTIPVLCKQCEGPFIKPVNGHCGKCHNREITREKDEERAK